MDHRVKYDTITIILIYFEEASEQNFMMMIKTTQCYFTLKVYQRHKVSLLAHTTFTSR